MTISDKLLTKQAWSLRVNLNRRLETESIKRITSKNSSIRIARLNTIQKRAYSRYLRRLKRLWE